MRHHRKTSVLRRALAITPAACLAVLAVLVMPAAVLADEVTLLTVAAPERSIASGDQVDVNILVTPGTAIAGLQMDLHFDPQLFAVQSVTAGDLFTQGGASALFNTGSIDHQGGLITGAFGFITTPGQAVSGKGTFATVTLMAIADSPACLVTLSSVLAGDLEGNPVAAEVTGSGSPDGAPEATFSWWALSLIIMAAVGLIALTTADLLYRRHVMLQALKRS